MTVRGVGQSIYDRGSAVVELGHCLIDDFKLFGQAFHCHKVRSILLSVAPMFCQKHYGGVERKGQQSARFWRGRAEYEQGLER
jgi:hypothetical protein